MGAALFLSEASYVARDHLLAARALAALDASIEPIRVDTSAWCAAQPFASFAPAGLRELTLSGSELDPDRQVDALASLLQETHARVVVLPHESGYAATALRVARALGVPTYQLQHGHLPPRALTGEPRLVGDELPLREPSPLAEVASGVRRVRRGSRRLASAARALLASSVKRDAPGLAGALRAQPFAPGYHFRTTRVGVTGPYYERRLIERGVARERIDVVGSLSWEHFAKQPALDVRELCAHLDIPAPASVFAAYFFSPYEEDYAGKVSSTDAVLDAYHALKATDPRATLLVLEHPRYPRALDPVLAQRLPDLHVRATGELYPSIVRAARLIFGVASSTLLDALAARRLVVIQAYVTPEVIQGLPLESNAVVAVHHRPHLHDQVARALHDGAFVERILANQQGFVDDVLGPADGRCAERAARGLLLTLGQTPPPAPDRESKLTP